MFHSNFLCFGQASVSTDQLRGWSGEPGGSVAVLEGDGGRRRHHVRDGAIEQHLRAKHIKKERSFEKREHGGTA